MTKLKKDKYIEEARAFCHLTHKDHPEYQVIAFHLMQLRHLKAKVRAMRRDVLKSTSSASFHEAEGFNQAIDKFLKML